MHWWTTRGACATDLRSKEEELLRIFVRRWGNCLLHIFDRGYVSGPWLQVLQSLGVRYVIRWKKGLIFFTVEGQEKKLWQIGQGKKYLSHKELFDVQTQIRMAYDIWWAPVWHEASASQLYVVKVRAGKKIWYLITNERIQKEEQAWEIVFAYRRRWQIETSFRYGKSELAMESPRLWSFENRLKLLGMVTLVYAFLLHLMDPIYQHLVQSVLSLRCHRTGKRCQKVFFPLYRLRWAISRLWNDYPPALGSPFLRHLQRIQAAVSFKC